MEDSSNLAARQAAQIITRRLLGPLGLSNRHFRSPNITVEDKNIIPSDIKTSQNLKSLEENAINILQKRKSLKENIEILKTNISNLETELSKKQEGMFNRLFTKKQTLNSIESEIESNRTLLNNVIAELENCQLDIDGLENTNLQDNYGKVVSTFTEILRSKKIWDIVSTSNNVEQKSSASSSVSRIEVAFFTQSLDFVKCKYPALHFQNVNASGFYLYPTFILFKGQDEIKLISLTELDVTFLQQRFIESEMFLPDDAEIVDYVWAKVNKDGSPDMRFKGNYKSPVVHYGSLNLSCMNGLNETYYISSFNIAQNFANEFLSYISLLKNDNKEPVLSSMPNITKQYFDTMKEFADKFLSFISKIKSDKEFIKFIYQTPSLKNHPFDDSDELIHALFMFDIMKCFNLTADISNPKSKEAFALIYLTAIKSGLQISGYSSINILYQEKLLTTYLNLFQNLKNEIEKPTEDAAMFRLSIIMSAYNKEWQKEYLTNLYRLASIVIKADGTVSKEEEEVLKKIMFIPEEIKTPDISNEKQNDKKVKESVHSKKQTIEEALEELNTLIGLSAVKQEINSLINFIKVQKARESTGLKSSSLSYHIVFTGNPGTGKTTVARIISNIYKSLGVLAQGQLIETDRSGMVAEYVGQTAVKVNKTVDSALNGILFIDEAYSLVGETQDSFGKEAVSTLIKRMEDNRDKLVVILAGYTNEMKQFIETNPGFKSRFNRYIEFVDYNSDELLAIFKLQCKKLEYILTEEAEKKLNEFFMTAFSNRDKSFGNGRFVRNTFEKVLERQANRIANIPSLTKEILTSITIDDIAV